MIGFPLCPEDTAGTRSWCCELPGSTHKRGERRLFINGHLTCTATVWSFIYNGGGQVVN
ncbi:unnamed protein product, partial [Staurois parvus]